MTHHLSFTNLLAAAVALTLVAVLKGDVTWTIIFIVCAVVCGLAREGGD